MNKTTDVAISEPSITHQRQKVISFSGPIYVRDLYFKSLLPKPLASYTTLLRPFQSLTWIGCVLSITCASLALMLVEIFFDSGRVIENICIAISSMLHMSLPYSYFERNVSNGEKIFFCILLPCGVLINLVYTSILLANLITIQYAKPINTAQDVLDSGLLITGPKQAFIFQSVLQNPKPIYQKLKALGRLQPYDMRSPEETAIRNDWVTQGLAVKPDYTLELFGVEDKFRLGTEMIAQSYTGWAFAKSSPLTKPASLLIQRLVDGGLINKWVYNVKSEKTRQKSNVKQRLHIDEPLTINHCLPMILILPFGFVPALIALLSELFYRRVTNKSH